MATNDLIEEPSTRSARAPATRSETTRTQRRRKSGGTTEDPFRLSDELRSELESRGLSAEWKRTSFFGKEEDPQYMIDLQENGAWEPLTLTDFPDFKKHMPKNWTRNTFERRGQILMVRPKEFTEEAREEERRNAENQVRNKISSLKADTSPGEADRAYASVKRTYERGVPVD